MVRDADHEVTVVALHCYWRRFLHCAHCRRYGRFVHGRADRDWLTVLVVGALRRLVHRPALSTQILLLQLSLVVVTVGVGVVIALLEARRQLDHAAGRRSLVIARTVAAVPQIAPALRLRHPERVIDPIAERIR